MPSPLTRHRAAALALLAALPSAAARADTLDLSMPRTVVVGAPQGPAPSERVDPYRTGRARGRLPSSPVELWRRHVSGNIDVSPVVDAAGNVLVALTIPEIVALGPDAREKWRARLGNASALAPPTLLSDGGVAVVTSAGVAWGFASSGALRFSTPLGIPRRDADTAPLALSDGGLVIAAGNIVVELDADGAVRARAPIDERTTAGERAAGAVIEGPGRGPLAGGSLVTAASGNVYFFRPPASPRRVGSFGGTTPRGALLSDDRTLVAVVDGRRLVALDLPTGVAHVRSGGHPFDGPPTMGPHAVGGGVIFVGTQDGMLLGIDAAGNERTHVLLDRPPPLPLPGALGTTLSPADFKPSPPVVADASGRVAFVRGAGRAGLVAPNGRLDIASERLCASPIAVLPGGDRRMLIACHDGGLWMFGE